MLRNLVSNSSKFTQSRGTIKIAVALDPRDKNYAIFTVHDNGCGIPPNVIPLLGNAHLSVFWPLLGEEYSTHNLGGLNPNGIGLGLNICNKLIGYLAHAGTKFTVESVLGEWTKFSFPIR